MDRVATLFGFPTHSGKAEDLGQDLDAMQKTEKAVSLRAERNE